MIKKLFFITLAFTMLCACQKAHDASYTGNPLSLGTPACGNGDVCQGDK